MNVALRLPDDRSGVALWLVVLASVAVTDTIFIWAPQWVRVVETVCLAGAVIGIAWLGAPLVRHWWIQHTR